MVFKLLRKNPIERLGSRHYQDLKGHPFFGGFNWNSLSASKFICDIPAIAEVMGAAAASGFGDDVPLRESPRRPVSASKGTSKAAVDSPGKQKPEDQLCEYMCGGGIIRVKNKQTHRQE